jgi:NADH-quinone oxidoreductase subunit C
MTVALSAGDIVDRLAERFPGSLEEAGKDSVLVRPESLLDVLSYLRDDPGFKLEYFNYVTAVDYYTYYEVVYQLTSLEHNHSLIIKTRTYDRENPSVPSVTGLWQGADFQEREVYDLMGISFKGHPNLKRIFLWEGFDGHPLRKEFNR